MSQKTVVVVINTIREIGEEEREKREEQLVAGAREGDGRESTYVHCIHRWSNKQARRRGAKRRRRMKTKKERRRPRNKAEEDGGCWRKGERERENSFLHVMLPMM
jgi:hypothetical protein